MAYSLPSVEKLEQRDANVVQSADTHDETPPPLREASGCLPFVGFCVLAFFLLARARGYAPDDAFIFYRYARNIGTGAGWVFNPGQQTANAATSPLWAALLAAAGFMFGYGPKVAQAVYIMCLAGGAAYLSRLFARQRAAFVGAAAGLLLIFNPVLLSTVGMESALFIFLAVGLLYADFVGRREVFIGAVGGALILVRPEGAILVGIVWLMRWVRASKLPWQRTVALIATVVPWAVFSMVAFGSPVAETLAAKTAQGRSGYFGPRFAYLRYIEVILDNPWSAAELAAAIVGVVIVAGRVVRSVRARTPGGDGVVRRVLADPLSGSVIAISAFAGLHTVGYGLLIRPPSYAWYYATPYLAMTVLAGVAIGTTIDVVRLWMARPNGSRRALRWAVISVVAAVLLLAIPRLMVDAQWTGNQLCGYTEAGRLIAANTDPDASVAAAEIGMMGWSSNREMVDYLGLLDPKSTDEMGLGDMGSWLKRTKPDVYIAHLPTWWIEVQSIYSDEFVKHYRPKAEVAGVGWSAVRVFERIDAGEVSASDGGASTRPILSPALMAALSKDKIALDSTQLDALAALLSNYVADPVAQLEAETPRGVDFGVLHRHDQSTKTTRLEQWAVLGSALDGFVSPLAPRLPRHAC